MKNILIPFFLCFPCFLFSQTPDSSFLAMEIDSLIQLNRALISDGKFEEAIRTIELAKSKAKSSFGKQSQLFAKCAHNHGRTFYFAGQAAEAERYYLEADSAWDAAGRDNADCAQNLFNLGLLYYESGFYKEAEPYYIESMEIRKEVLGDESNPYLYSVNYLAYLYDEMGKFDLAEPLYLQCKEIRGRVWGGNSPEYADILSDLSIFYDKTGRYEEAESLQLEAIAIRKEQGEYFDYAVSLSNLGILYQVMGQYVEAEKILLESKHTLEILEETESDRYADCLNNLGTVYLRTGRFEQADTVFRKALVILEKQGKEKPGYTMLLNNLGVLYWTMGHYAEAEPLFLESFQIREEKGKERPEYLESLDNLGNLYWATGRYDLAESKYTEAKTLRETILGKDHPGYAQSLNNLAMLYQRMGRHEEVIPLLKEARAVIAGKFGKEHRFYTDISDNLAINLCFLKQPEQASELFLEINALRKDLIAEYSRYLSEQDLSSYISLFVTNLEEFYSFCQNNGADMPDLLPECYDNVLFHKGFLLETINQRKDLIQADPHATQIHNQQKSYLRRLAGEYSKPISERDQMQMMEWREKTREIERELIQSLEGYGQLGDQVAWKSVQDKLGLGSAAIEFVHYRYHNPEPADSIMYAALILLPGEKAPRFIPLFDERQLLPLMKQPGLPDELVVKDLYGNRPDLYRILGRPLEPILRDVNTIYYSPSGLLHFINPAALADESGRGVSSGKQWVRVSSTRNLVISPLAGQSFAKPASGNDRSEPTALLYGGIEFDMDSLAFIAKNNSVLQDTLLSALRKDGDFQFMVGERIVPRGGRGEWTDKWEFLPGTEREVDRVSAILQNEGFSTEVLKGLSASEERLKNLGMTGLSPRIFLIATHGFAYPDPKKESGKMFDADLPVFRLYDDPMLRSGLLLAGSNFYWKNKRPLANFEDGVLVAYEVRDLNLRNTELAVLSACQTGLGDVESTEGLYGLQRAFRIAGARFLIVSLWRVPDQQTEELMLLFFQNWVERGESMRDAFNHAQRAMQEKYENPYLWAGFVLVE